ncbi:MAG: PaaI family thioesterase [Parvularcula sp.]
MTSPDTETLPAWIHDFLPADAPNILSARDIFRDVAFHPTPVAPGRASLRTRLPAHFLDGETLHGGIYTILLDTVLAIAIWTRLEQFEPLVTINLKTDFFRSVPAGTDLSLDASCEDIVDNVAVSRGEVQDPDGRILASAEGTFLVGGASPDRGSRL